MKKLMLISLSLLVCCDEPPLKTFEENVREKNIDLKDCTFNAVKHNYTTLYVIRCPLSNTSVNWIRRSGKLNYEEATVTVEDLAPKEDPELTAIKEKAEKLGYKVEKR
jgi:hypothetical protein